MPLEKSQPISLGVDHPTLVTKHLNEPTVITHKYIYDWNHAHQDGIQLLGKSRYIVSSSLMSRTGLDPAGADELSSCVHGADVIYYRCTFKDSGKGMLHSNGDSVTADLLAGMRVIFIECLFDNVSRRNPYIKGGQGVMINCWVTGWGRPESFHETCYGVRVGYNAQAIIHSCGFEQDDYWTCMKRGHIVKDAIANLKWPPFPLFGHSRAVFTDNGGQVQAYNCYKSHSWLSIEGHRGNYMNKEEATALKKHIYSVTPQQPPEDLTV